MGRRLVEDEVWGVAEQRAREREAAALTAGELLAVLADQRVEAGADAP